MEATKKRQRLVFVQIATAIAIMLVVFGHAMPIHFDYPDNDYLVKWVKILIEYVYTFHMPLFFFLSGYLFAYTSYESQRREYKGFLRAKVLRLLVPYIVISSVAFLPKVGLSQYAVNPVELTWFAFVETIIYPWKNTVRYFWFLPTLFVMFVVAPALLHYLRTKREQKSFAIKYMILIGLLLANQYFPEGFEPQTLFNYSGILHYLIYFWLGMWVCEFAAYWISNLEKNKSMLLLLSVASFTFQITLFVLFKDNEFISFDLLLAVLGIVGTIAVSILLVSLQKTSVLTVVGANAYQIYLLSWFFQVPVQLVGYKIFHLSGFSIMLIAFIVGIIGPMIVTRLILRFKIPGKSVFGL